MAQFIRVDFAYGGTCLSIYLGTRLSIYLGTYLSIYVCIYLFINLYWEAIILLFVITLHQLDCLHRHWELMDTHFFDKYFIVNNLKDLLFLIKIVFCKCIFFCCWLFTFLNIWILYIYIFLIFEPTNNNFSPFSRWNVFF